ncbi:MAG: tRNA (N6-isopentenyl adenosine(37)-C2)-methylthiotransferase MiaB [Acidobacteriota bacterium]
MAGPRTRPARSFHIETWGCQMNVHDTEKMAGILASLGYAPADGPGRADLILLNTCSVREKAAAKVFNRLGRLRRLKRRNPDLMIGVCGCVAQVEGEAIFRRAPYVDLIMGPRNIAQLGSLLERARRDGRSISLARSDDPIVFPSGTAARSDGPRAYVTVMEGCNKSCSFCIVPFTRGREVYRPAGDILAEVRELAARGFQEIEFLGQNVNAYHHGAEDLASLLEMADRVPQVRRIRFTTSHPGHLKRRIMDAMRDVPSVCNHLHLPVQSGSDRVLRMMNRGYTRARYLEKIDALRARVPDVTFSTDVIVGFPGETEAEFEQTLSLLRVVGFEQVFAFAYSPRPGTPAARMTDRALSEEVKADRLRRLLALQEEMSLARNASLVGRTFEVLIDGRSRMDPATLKGRTTCNRIVNVAGSDPSRRGFLTVRITRGHAHSLTGVPLEGARAA